MPSRLALRTVLSVVAALIAGPAVAQAPIVFDLGQSPIVINNPGPITFTQDGVTLTLSNPNGAFTTDGDGLRIGTAFANTTTLDLAFSAPGTLTAYSIGFVNAGATTGTFTISAPGGTSSGNDLSAVGSFSLSTPITFSLGDTAAFSASIPSGGLSQIRTLTFTPVPEPTTVLGVSALGVAAVRFVRRRRTAAV